jgi:uncharacterized protein (UPF0332 family)
MMSLDLWCKNGWLRPHRTNRAQVSELFAIVDRDLEDARTERLSSDWQFGIAYNAALKLCTILLYAEGYRPEKTLAHYRSLQSLPMVLGANKQDDADYLETCRNKRNTAEYDTAGRISQDEARELLCFSTELREVVIGYLKSKHPDLL